MNVLDLFSGIGGFSLGLERAGMRTVAFCEIEPYCRAVLRKHWPDVPCYDDVRTLTVERLAADGIRVDVICGGFPCQDVSIAGRRGGLTEKTRSGLWSQFSRLIGELRPQYVVVENTTGLLSLGMGTVLGDLAACGYDAEWDVVPAESIGAQHIRERVWIVAYPNEGERWGNVHSGSILCQGGESEETKRRQDRKRRRLGFGNGAKNTHADAMRQRLQGGGEQGENESHAAHIFSRLGLADMASVFDRSYWRHQPLLGRGFHGIPRRVDRIKSLGNAVVPQIPELIGRAIMQAEGLAA